MLDFVHGLQHLDYTNINRDEVNMLFARFGDCLTLKQFTDLVLPYSLEFANLINQRPNYFSKKDRAFICSTRMQIVALFKVLLAAECRLESLRRNLSIDLRLAFELLNTNSDGYVRMSDLREFCAS